MKRSINRNILWTKIFVNRLANLGVKYVCISPGSRSTPLTLSFAEEERIKKYVIVDERSSGFFALGLANQTNSPVVLVTTSGTATAELYPAVIEAYQQRIPLIVCTADRPPELLNTGANQTINQNNLYKNHIYGYFDAGAPDSSKDSLYHINSTSLRTFNISMNEGPVHINFPFRKPFEPESFTDEIEEALINPLLIKENESLSPKSFKNSSDFKHLTDKFQKIKKGLFVVGPGKYAPEFSEQLTQISEKLGYPVITDGASNLRFGNRNFITNSSAFLKSDKFRDSYDPELIIHFGAAPTSNLMLRFFAESKAEKYLINEQGDWQDPSNTAKQIIALSPSQFGSALNELIQQKNENSDWLNVFLETQSISQKIKENFLRESDISFEGKLVSEVFRLLPENTNLMLGNSMPVRDVDLFGKSDKQLNIFANRGASGIDGLNSTALGIAAESENPTVLLVGDLGFFHDSNGLQTAYKYGVPLTIIIIDNNGGGIFGMLPIAGNKDYFEQYFKTPLNIDFSHLAKLYQAEYYLIKNTNELEEKLVSAVSSKKLNIFHIKTDAEKSIELRRKFRDSVTEEVEKYFHL